MPVPVIMRSLLLSITMLCVLAAPAAAAELVFTFEVSGKYEDNITGVARDNPNIGVDVRHGGGQTVGGVHLKGGLDDIISGGTGTGAAAGKQSDFSSTLYADIGASWDLAEKTHLLLLVSAEHTAYNKFSELDFTIGALSASIGHRFSEGFSGKLEASAARRDVKVTGADSSVLGLTATLKERPAASLWFKESLTVEQSKADESVNDYTGTSASVRAGYDLSNRSSLSAGYSYLFRDFKNSAVGAQTNVQAASLDWSLDLGDHWVVLAGYDHEWVKATSNIASASVGNNIYSIGVRYDY